MRVWRSFVRSPSPASPALIVLALSLVACGGSGGSGDPVDPPEPVARVEVSPQVDTILVKASVTLSARTFDSGDEELTGRTLTWAVSSPAIASVSPGGVVTGSGMGTVTVTATAEGHSDQAVLTFVPKVVIGRRFPSLFA